MHDIVTTIIIRINHNVTKMNKLPHSIIFQRHRYKHIRLVDLAGSTYFGDQDFFGLIIFWERSGTFGQFDESFAFTFWCA